jgi:hypothetical protein
MLLPEEVGVDVKAVAELLLLPGSKFDILC